MNFSTLLVEDTLTVIGQVGSIGTAIGTIALVILFWKTIQQLEETVKLSRIQANYRFRPWVGPVGNIELLSTADGKHQFSITVKNYGEIPSSDVKAKYNMSSSPINKDVLKSDKVNTFNLGPLLPNMEKRYWFFIDSNLIQKVGTGDAQVFIILYFPYEHLGGISGYGTLSRYDSTKNAFIHTDMWID